MHLIGVDVINRPPDRDPLVQIATGDQTPAANFFDEQFGFDLRHSVSPNLITVDIQKLGAAGDIYIDADVVNPTGWTRVINLQGDILSGAASAEIETNVLDIEATVGNIGGNAPAGGMASQRVNVDLVRSPIIPEFPGDPTGTREFSDLKRQFLTV